ncbi:MAG: hypothetical protein AAF804_20450, partial [Bacteroidota bacterium]
QIYLLSQDPKNWGVAKSLVMEAEKAGVDVDNQRKLNRYIRRQSAEKLRQLSEKPPIQDLSPAEDPPPSQYLPPTKGFSGKKFGRNEKVSVRYHDGRELHDIKYKRIAQDLEEGKCELIE